MNKDIKVKDVIVKSGCDKFLPFGLTDDDDASGERTGGFGSTDRG